MVSRSMRFIKVMRFTLPNVLDNAYIFLFKMKRRPITS